MTYETFMEKYKNKLPRYWLYTPDGWLSFYEVLLKYGYDAERIYDPAGLCWETLYDVFAIPKYENIPVPLKYGWDYNGDPEMVASQNKKFLKSADQDEQKLNAILANGNQHLESLYFDLTSYGPISLRSMARCFGVNQYGLVGPNSSERIYWNTLLECTQETNDALICRVGTQEKYMMALIKKECVIFLLLPYDAKRLYTRIPISEALTQAVRVPDDRLSILFHKKEEP